MCCGQFTWFDDHLRRLFSKLGYLIGYHPVPFVLIPLLLVLGLLQPFMAGFSASRTHSQVGSIDLFTPENTESLTNKRKMARLFPDGGYFSDRTLLSPNLLIGIMSSKLGTGVLDDAFLKAYERLRRRLETLNINYNGSSLSYAKLCKNEQFSSHCNPDPFISLWKIHTQTSFLPLLTYPVINVTLRTDIQTITRSKYIGPLLGNVVTNKNGAILTAEYVKMIFNLPPTVPVAVLELLAKAWKTELEQYRSTAVNVLFWNPQQFQTDMREISRRTGRLLPFLVAFLLGFSLLSCCMADAVLSKPFLAIAGIFSASCGILCAHATLFLCDVELIEIAMIVPFLVLSIGVDDMFVMLNVWRKTDERLSVAERLGRTYRDAAVSITVTSATDAVVFGIGIGSVFSAIRIFCLYCCVSILFVFVFQLTLFGAFMAVTGYREAASRHCITFRKVPVKDRYRCCFGVVKSHSTAHNDSYKTRPWPSVYFAEYHSALLIRKWTQRLVIVSYLAFISISAYFLATKMKQGLEISTLLPYDTETYHYLNVYETHFSSYSTSAEVVIAQPLDYYDGSTRQRLFGAVEKLENTKFTRRSSFWLRDFIDFATSFNVANRRAFYDLLLHKFLRTEAFGHYAADLVLVSDGERTVINCSRFFVPLVNQGHANRSLAMHVLRSTLENIRATYPGLELLVYDVSFPLAEQYDSIPLETCISVLVCGAAVLIISLLFIANFVGCLTVACTVISINVGVVAFLAVWSIKLDIISKITILLSIGFSVDFSAHIAYHFYHADTDKVDQRLRYCLETVGWPILQSSLSTLAGVVVVVWIRAYVAETFFKTVLLVMLVGVYHGLFVLPVLLLLAHQLLCPSPDPPQVVQNIVAAPPIAVVHPIAKRPPSTLSFNLWTKSKSHSTVGSCRQEKSKQTLETVC